MGMSTPITAASAAAATPSAKRSCSAADAKAPSTSRTNTQPRAHPSTPMTTGMSAMLAQAARWGTSSRSEGAA